MYHSKYRIVPQSAINKGLYSALRAYARKRGVPLSQLLDDAVEDYLRKHNLSYDIAGPGLEEWE